MMQHSCVDDMRHVVTSVSRMGRFVRNGSLRLDIGGVLVHTLAYIWVNRISMILRIIQKHKKLAHPITAE